MAEALSVERMVEIRPTRSTIELKVPDHLRCEAEVEVNGDHVELEFELKWSTARTGTVDAQSDGDAPA